MKIGIIGAGYGGLNIAKELEKKRARSNNI